MKIFISTWTIMLLLVTCSVGQASDREGVQQVSAPDFSERVAKGNGQLIDVRTSGEFETGHIAGASLIDFYGTDYRDRLAQLDKNVPVYIYCRSGNRSGKTVALLKELGFVEIVNLEGGLIEWQKAVV